MNGNPAHWFERPAPKRTGPDRRAHGYYRSAASDGKAVGGVPLDSVEAAVVAAVRMGYKVAEAQIDRSARLARRLREAGDRVAGPGSERQALDATERLIFRAMMAALSWLEGAAAGGGNPLRRLAAAEFRILGSLLGLTPSEPPKSPDGRAPEEPSGRAGASGPGNAASRKDEPSRFQLRIKHGRGTPRAVRVCAWQFAGDAAAIKVPVTVTFYSVERIASKPLEGKLAVSGKRSATLTVTTSRLATPGIWKAAICDADMVQVGYIEIML